MSLRSITFYIYIKSLSKALNIPEEKVLSAVSEVFGERGPSEPRKDSTMYM
jgi:hypothetical protein